MALKILLKFVKIELGQLSYNRIARYKGHPAAAWQKGFGKWRQCN